MSSIVASAWIVSLQLFYFVLHKLHKRPAPSFLCTIQCDVVVVPRNVPHPKEPVRDPAMSKVETGTHVWSVRVHARASLGTPCWGVHTKSQQAGSQRRPRQSRRQQRRPHTLPSSQIRCCGPAGRLASDGLESKKCDDFAPKFNRGIVIIEA